MDVPKIDPSKLEIVMGPPGCICGTAKIMLNRFGKAFSTSLSELYDQGLEPIKPKSSSRKITTRSLTSSGIFRLNEILEIIPSGVKETVTVKTTNRELSLTPDHLILDSELRWVEAGSIVPGYRIMVEGKSAKLEPPSNCYLCDKPIRIKLAPHHKFYGQCYSCVVSEIRRTKPDAAIDKNGYILRKCPGHYRAHRGYVLEHILVVESKINRRLEPGERTHHVDRDITNNDDENLELVTQAGHSERHSWFINLASEVFVPIAEEILSIEPGGFRETFDMRMNDPDNNFIANGIVVHNCGKTTDSLRIVEEALAAGVRPSEVCFVTFTQKGATEGRERAARRFGIDPDKLPHFRTIHSFAFRQVGATRDSMLGWPHIREFAKSMGIDMKGKQSGDVRDDDVYGMNEADRMLFMDGLAKAKQVSLRTVWEEAFEDAVDWYQLDQFSRALQQYKFSRGLRDYNDLLIEFNQCDVGKLPRFKVLIVDEAQDLSILQWTGIAMLASVSERVYVFGDDDQAIFEWSGAAVEYFISLVGRTRVLKDSYRIPANVFKVVNDISSKIANRRPKEWRSRAEPGAVNWHGSVEEVDLSRGTWMVLARNGYMLDDLEEWCMSQGLTFHSVNRDPLKNKSLAALRYWETLRKGLTITGSELSDMALFVGQHWATEDFFRRAKKADPRATVAMSDVEKAGVRTRAPWFEALSRISPKDRDYYIAARRRGEALFGEPRIKISTIHASKGGEAENVVLLTEMSYRCWNNMQENPDTEHRCFYVGASRCKDSLNLIQPRSNLGYEI